MSTKIGLAALVLILLLLPRPSAALDLRQSVAAALDFRPDLEREGALVAAAEAAIDAAVAGYLPELNLGASAGWRTLGTDGQELVEAPLAATPEILALAPEETPSSGGGSSLEDSFGFESDWRYGGLLEARQLIFDGFGTLAAIAGAEARRDGRLANYREAVELVALEAVQAYLDVLRNRGLAEVARSNLEAHRRLTARVHSLGQGGQVTQADVSQADARLALAEAELAERVGLLAQAVARFVSRIGEAPDDLAPAALPGGRPLDEAAAVASALQGHPGLAAAQAGVAAGQADSEAAGAAFWPQLDLVARAEADRSIEILGQRTLQAEALAQLSWNLYRGGGDSALLRQAEATLAATRYDLAARRRSVEEEARVAYRQLLTAEAVALPLQRHAEAAAKVLRAYGQQFDIGRRSLLDLLDAQNELAAAQLRAVDAQYRLLLANYELAYAMGSLTALLGLPARGP